jgi:hypothetical protein
MSQRLTDSRKLLTLARTWQIIHSVQQRQQTCQFDCQQKCSKKKVFEIAKSSHTFLLKRRTGSENIEDEEETGCSAEENPWRGKADTNG